MQASVAHFFHNQVKNAYEAVAPDPTKSHFEDKRVRLASCVLHDTGEWHHDASFGRNMFWRWRGAHKQCNGFIILR